MAAPNPEYTAVNASTEVDEEAALLRPRSREKVEGQAGEVGTAVNMACNIMGGALLVLPTAMMNASAVPGMLMTFVFGLFSCSTMVMLTDCAEVLQCFSFKTLVERTTNARLAKLLEVCLFFYTYGVLVEYGRIIVDSMPHVVTDLFHGHGIWAADWLWLLVACMIFLPLTSLPALAKLKWTSILGLVTILYILAIVVVYYFIGDYRQPHRESLIAADVDWFHITSSIVKAVPVLSVSFSCHYNVPFYYKELSNRKPRTFHKVMLLVMPFLIYLYWVTGGLGYFMFGNEAITAGKGNIVNCFRANDVAVNIGRLGLFFHFVTAYPIVAIGCRNCLNNLIFATPSRPQWMYVAEAFALVSTAGVLAYVVSGIGVVVDVIGSLFGIYIVMVIPSIVYIGTYRNRPWWPLFPIRLAAAKGVSGEQGADQSLYSNNSIAAGQQMTPAVPVKPFLYYLAHFFIPFGFAVSITSFIITLLKEVI